MPNRSVCSHCGAPYDGPKPHDEVEGLDHKGCAYNGAYVDEKVYKKLDKDDIIAREAVQRQPPAE